MKYVGIFLRNSLSDKQKMDIMHAEGLLWPERNLAVRLSQFHTQVIDLRDLAQRVIQSMDEARELVNTMMTLRFGTNNQAVLLCLYGVFPAPIRSAMDWWFHHISHPYEVCCYLHETFNRQRTDGKRPKYDFGEWIMTQSWDTDFSA